MGGNAQKNKTSMILPFFFHPNQAVLRHFALFTTTQVAFVYKFFMHKGIAGHITG